eukprot:15462965-Alexandrium_andersonii.AAC.1
MLACDACVVYATCGACCTRALLCLGGDDERRAGDGSAEGPAALPGRRRVGADPHQDGGDREAYRHAREGALPC